MAKFDIDLYKELEVSSDATREEIRLKDYTLSRRYHPDFNQNTPNATEKAKRLNLAWDILGDNAKRVEYDLEWSRKTGNRNSHEAYSEAKKREQEEQKTKRREEELRRSEAKKHEQEKQKINRREEELRRAEEVKQRGKTRRQGWNEGESYLDAQTRLEMIWIPKGIFSMGCDYLLKNEKPVRRVNLDGFWMSRNVVTVGRTI
ncbi:MAG: DnaJ domain-containing protein [Armatimonadetes bacterium]|nr:DnaJ domain-containing protein [Armatimonadota bacterium]